MHDGLEQVHLGVRTDSPIPYLDARVMPSTLAGTLGPVQYEQGTPRPISL